MSFAEQLALASRKKRNINVTTRTATTAHTSLSNNDKIDNAGLSFADSIRVASPTATAAAISPSEIKAAARAIAQPRPPSTTSSSSSVSSFSFANELQKRSQLGKKKGGIEQQHAINYDDQSEDDYSAIVSIASTPSSNVIPSTATADIKNKKKGGSEKKLKPVKIAPSNPVGEENSSENDTIDLDEHQLPKSQPSQQQNLQPTNNMSKHSNVKVTNNDNSDHNTNNGVFGAWAQIETLKRRVREAEERAQQESQRAEKANYELELVRDRSTPPISNVDDGSSDYDVSSDDNEYVIDDSNIISSPLSSFQHNEVDRWKNRALQAEERLLSHGKNEQRGIEQSSKQRHLLQPMPQQHHLLPPQSVTQPSVCEMDEESTAEIIRLKNAEIDVLRSQVQRLERRIQDEFDRGEDLLLRKQQQSSYLHLHHYDGSASSTGPPSVVGVDVGRDELRLLRNEIRNLQHQLSRKDTTTMNNLSGKNNHGNGNTTAASTTGSTLSSLDEHENHDDAEEEEVYDEDDDEVGGGGCCSSWGLCCVRKRGRRRGYGRV